jgi:DNA-binding CsgD family transcriptional regulator/tetratricopeptide (TPR) repeat protein
MSQSTSLHRDEVLSADALTSAEIHASRARIAAADGAQQRLVPAAVTPERELMTVQAELLERDAELVALDALLSADSGWGRLLAIEGPPGIGKTSLILETRLRAVDAGTQVLSARGSELETTFSFGVVRQLFEPLLAQLAENERAELLDGAAELATPIFEPAHLAADPARDVSLAMLHGLYWLTANVAAQKPLLLAVDDLHWSDPPSLRWLAYVLPRMDGLDLSIVAGLRPAEPGEAPALLSQIVSDPRTLVIQPAPLSLAATARLVRATLSPGADDAFCMACHEITGGNPLLLRDLRNAIIAEDLAPTSVNIPLLRELAARAGSRALSARLSPLPREATRLAQAVAILGEGVDAHHAAALADLDEQAASEAIADLARVDVLSSQTLLGFVHPLVRAAVYQTLTPLERNAGHTRAARLLSASQADPERVAAHLLLVSPASEREVVAVLREAARRAECRGASESAVAYLRRALAEPPAAADRADVLLELGYVEALVSGAAAVEHLQEAHALIDDPIRRGETAVLLGRELEYLDRVDESVKVLRQALGEVAGAGTDPELERVLEAVLVQSSLFESEVYEEARRRLHRVRENPDDGTEGGKMLVALLAYHDARAGAPADEVVEWARRALAGGTLLAGEIPADAFVLACTVLARADVDQTPALYDAALAEAHRRGSVLSFASAKLHRGQMSLFRGDLADAEADVGEALQACESWGAPARFWSLWGPLPLLSDILAEQGRLTDATAALGRADWGETVPGSAQAYFFLDSRARVRVLGGDLHRGLDDSLDSGSRFEEVGGVNPAFVAWRSQAALASLKLGDPDEARRLASEELGLARTWGAPRALGAALRAAGLVEGGKAGLALLEEAVEVLADSPAKLEHAKACAELGAALRRANRRSQAREHLRRAVELATICGATPLAARAETELLATGARPRRIALSGVDSLTPSERRVADLAADGPTNREIAQALFVTPKTVEVHLSRVYRKLGISSRSQLADALVESARA